MNFRNFFLVFTLLVAFLLGLPEFISLNFLKPVVLPIADGALGRSVKIHGNIHMRLVPYVRLIVDGIEIDNVRGAARDKFATIDSVILNVDFLPLLRGRVVLNARISNPHINLEVFENGKNNWSFAETLEKQQQELNPVGEASDPNKWAGWRIKIDNVKVGDAFIEYKDRKVTKAYELTTVGLGATTLTGPFFINGRLYHDFKKYDFSLRAKRFIGKNPSQLLVKFREADDFFSTVFRGTLTLDPFVVSGGFEGRASMRKLNIDGLLLKHLSIHPISHIMLTSHIQAQGSQFNLSQIQLKLPLATVSGQARVSADKAFLVSAKLSGSDGGSYVVIENDQAKSHKFDFRMTHMGKLLKLYQFDTPAAPDAMLTYSGALVWQNGAYVLNAAPLAVDQAQAQLSFRLTPQRGKAIKLNTGLAVGDMASWRNLLNVQFFPGLDGLTMNLQAEGKQDHLRYQFQTNFDDSGVLESRGELIQQEILKGNLALRYKDARDLAFDMNARRIPEMGPFVISCDINSKGNQTVFENLVFDTKPIRGKGRMAMETQGEQQSFDVRMDWDQLDIWSLLNFEFADEPTEEQKKSNPPPVVSSWPKDKIAWPLHMKVNMDVRVKEVSFFQPMLRNASLAMQMSPALNLRLRGQSALTQKDCDVFVGLEPGKYRHTITTEANLQQIPIFPFMQLLTTAVGFGGGLTARMNVSTKGLSVQEIMQSLNGTLLVQADGAFIQGYNLRRLSRNPSSIGGMLMNTLFRKQAEGKGLGLFDVKEEKSQSTPIKTLKADVKISSGNATFRDIILDADGVYGKADGQLDLGKRLMNMRGSMVFPEIQLKDVPSLMFTLVGSLDNPKFDSNVDKFVDYFISNVLAGLIGKTLGSLLLNAIVPGLGIVASTVTGAIANADSAKDAPVLEDNSAKIKALKLPERVHQPTLNKKAHAHAR